MQPVFAFLAKFAELATDGTINIMGADFDQIVVNSLPSGVNVMLVAKFLPPEQALTGPVKLGLFITDPAGVYANIATPANPVVAPTPTARRAPSAVIVFQIGLLLHLEGDYLIHLNVDGQDMTRLPLKVSLANKNDSPST
jgi:hypothetical protein